MSPRRTAAAVCGLVAFVLVGGVAHASGGAGVGAAAAAVTPCTVAGVRAELDLDGLLVRSVTVRDLPAQCRGGSLRLTLGRSAGPDVGVSGPVTGPTLVLDVGRRVDARSVNEVAVALLG